MPLELLISKLKNYRTQVVIGAAAVLVLLGCAMFVTGVGLKSATPDGNKDSGRLITLYDRGKTTIFTTKSKTLKDAFSEHGVQIEAHDAVEPALSEELIAPEYKVNVYRARPVVVQDGAVRSKIVTPYQSSRRIVADAGVTLFAEDRLVLHRSEDYLGDGAGLTVTVDRATPLQLDLYGRTTEVRTQAKTVAELLTEKDIQLGDTGRTSVPPATPITAGMQLRVWREGVQVITADEPIAFDTEVIRDADRPLGYRAITTAGKTGTMVVHYEINIKDGVEVSRTKIAQIVAQAPIKQTEVMGVQADPRALTKAKGAQYFVDSRGVSHRETYYDLPMGVVMGACGQGGYYTVRADGAKVDRDGYILVAAHYGNYPKCSVVETSMGPGKVYDTGGFAARHPHGFDLATDWTNNDGR